MPFLTQRWKVKPHHIIKLAFQFRPKSVFLVHNGVRYSREQVFRQIRALAAGLYALDIRPGDRIAVLLPACPEAIHAMYLPSQIGTIHVPLNPLLGEKDLEEILRHSGAKVVITRRNWLGFQQAELLRRIRSNLPELKSIIVLENDLPYEASTGRDEDLIPYKAVLNKGRGVPKPTFQPDDPNLLCYTSGTTGHPKGVLHSSRRSWNVNLRDIWQRLRQQSLQCLLLPYPPFHFSGMFGITMTLLAGGKVVLMDRIDPNGMLELIETEKVTQIGAPATVYRLLLAAAEKTTRNLSSVRRLTFSSEKLSPQLAHSLHSLFNCKLENYYGTTEAHLISWTDCTGDWEAASDSVGKRVPGVEIRIVDENRRSLENGKVGEIAVRSPQMMLGYYKDPVRTEQVMDDDGWHYTGDAGYLDNQGFLHLSGRISELINRGGEKVHPEEVETYLESHPAIKRAAVIGVPNRLAGEEVLAFINTWPGKTITLEEVRQFCCGKIAPFKVPSDIRLINPIPMTANGKVQKFLLRESLNGTGAIHDDR